MCTERKAERRLWLHDGRTLETECCLCFNNTEKGEENREIEREIKKDRTRGREVILGIVHQENWLNQQIFFFLPVEERVSGRLRGICFTVWLVIYLVLSRAEVQVLMSVERQNRKQTRAERDGSLTSAESLTLPYSVSVFTHVHDGESRHSHKHKETTVK